MPLDHLPPLPRDLPEEPVKEDEQKPVEPLFKQGPPPDPATPHGIRVILGWVGAFMVLMLLALIWPSDPPYLFTGPERTRGILVLIGILLFLILIKPTRD